MLLDSERLRNLEVTIDEVGHVREVEAEVFLVIKAPLLICFRELVSLFNVVYSRISEQEATTIASHTTSHIPVSKNRLLSRHCAILPKLDAVKTFVLDR